MHRPGQNPAEPVSLPLRRNYARQTLQTGILQCNGRVEHLIEPNQIAERASLFEYADSCLGDLVVLHYVVITRDENAGFRAVENLVVPQAVPIAFEANPVEDATRKRL